MEFKDQYKHPLWQKKRLDVLNAIGFVCEDCGSNDKELHVHHVRYKKNAKIWEYELSELTALCNECHKDAHSSKDAINDFCLMNGAGSERTVAELVSGYSNYFEFGHEFVYSEMTAVGYGAGYLTNLSTEAIIKLATINPVVVEEFIERHCRG